MVYDGSGCISFELTNVRKYGWTSFYCQEWKLRAKKVDEIIIKEIWRHCKTNIYKKQGKIKQPKRREIDENKSHIKVNLI